MQWNTLMEQETLMMQERDRDGEVERLGQWPLAEEVGWDYNQSKWEKLIDY